jgi:hypothetical protein
VNRRDPALALGRTAGRGQSKAPLWADVPDDSGTTGAGAQPRVNDLEEIEQVPEPDRTRSGPEPPDKFRVDITPYFISLIDPRSGDPGSVVR